MIVCQNFILLRGIQDQNMPKKKKPKIEIKDRIDNQLYTQWEKEAKIRSAERRKKKKEKKRKAKEGLSTTEDTRL